MDERNGTESPFPQALVDAFRAHPDVPAFEYRSRPVTRGEVLDLIGRCVTGLRAAGLGPGSSVALATDVTPEGFAVQLAAFVLGCRVTGLRPGLTPEHLGQVLADDIDAVVTDDLAGRLGDVVAGGLGPAVTGRGTGPGRGTEPGRATVPRPGSDSPDAPAATVLRLRPDLPDAPPVTVLRLGPDLLDAHPAADDLSPQGRPDDIALVTLTSGSTGQPKGCAQTYRSMTAHWSWQPARWTDRTTALATAYARYLLFGTLTSAVIFEHLGLCLLGGGTAVIPDPPLNFPHVFAQHRISACLMTVPRLYRVLDTLREERVDTSSLRALVVAGSPLPPHRLALARERLGPVVYQGYGQTEAGMLALLTPDDLARWPEEALDSVGRPWVGVEMEIRDAEGRPVPSGASGEIWVRTATAMSGYWKDEERTREVLRDGWIRTRDIGRLDRHGLLRLTGRARDVIIINAVVHYAGAIERALTGHPDVDEAYVVGAPDEQTGEAAHAFVVPAPGRTPDSEVLRAHVTARLGAGSAPATVTVVRDVPVGQTGKPDKGALRARLDGGGKRR
ncbi:fatty acid--CoA ligase family protein [Streptomyces sp. NPDC003077]|uniref:class I adenylate-forming enzyme family protein n=1 Tax=Streptomyces sp. NPDC003077 TaxID=3154443 RepID=UPI0033B62E72